MSNGINVLNLCDGISCGKVALDRAGIKVNKYFSSEIDENAIAISKKNHDGIIRLGDITKLVEYDELDCVVLHDENGVMEPMKFVPEKKQEEKQSD